jgi:DNA-binding beta-propeller fold protein YncE
MKQFKRINMGKSLLIILFLSSIIANSQSFETIWATDRVLKTPESVFYNQQRNEIYVSNINGNPTDKDGNGFISLLDTTGNITTLKWISGFDAPKGMAVLHDTLIVTDIDKVHIISISQAKITQTIEVEGASFLNDAVLLDDGTAFITDMVVENIIMIKDGKAMVWLTDELLVKPNGLALMKNSLAVGVKNGILKVDTSSKAVKSFIEETGPVDGIIYLGGNKFVISDWAGRITWVSPSEKIVLSNSTDSNIQAADLGYITDKKWVLVPTFFDNRVIAAQLP